MLVIPAEAGIYPLYAERYFSLDAFPPLVYFIPVRRTHPGAENFIELPVCQNEICFTRCESIWRELRGLGGVVSNKGETSL